VLSWCDVVGVDGATTVPASLLVGCCLAASRTVTPGRRARCTGKLFAAADDETAAEGLSGNAGGAAVILAAAARRSAVVAEVDISSCFLAIEASNIAMRGCDGGGGGGRRETAASC
jgi:hypothetical protein